MPIVPADGEWQLDLLLQRHMAGVRLATGVLFVRIGLWLLYDGLRIWGMLSSLMAYRGCQMT